MIETVKTPTNDLFFNLVENANESIVLCAPFIKDNIVKRVLETKKPSVKAEVMTVSNLANFIRKSSDTEAIRTLIENNIPVKSYHGLHAKIYLFDNKRALVTSANLTNGGMFHNFEYGLYIEQDNLTVEKIVNDVEELFASSNCDNFDISDVCSIEDSVKKSKGKSTITLDEDDNVIVKYDDVNALLEGKTGWERLVLESLIKIPNRHFTLEEAYKFEKDLSKYYPNNKHIKDKIRQQLQNIAKRGLLTFDKPGHYTKLWEIK